MEGPAAASSSACSPARALSATPWKLYDTTISRSLCETLSSLAFGSRFRSSAVMAAGSADLAVSGK